MEAVELTPWQKQSREVAGLTAGMCAIIALGKFTGPLFMGNAFTFALASLIGYRVVWGVVPALHSPLMSVTNAISGMVGLGGLFILGGGYLPGTIPQALGALSVLLAFVNVGGGFVITKRMLDMFKREFETGPRRRCRSVTDKRVQDRLTPPSILGCTQFPQLSLAVALSPPLQPAPLVLSRQATL